MSQNSDSYNRIVEQWHEYRSKTAPDSCVIDFASRIKPGGKILDVGCGTGVPLARYLAQRGFLVTGIDVSGKMIAKARELNLANAEFHHRDFFDFQPAWTYDGVLAFDSFFHIPLKRQREIYPRLSSWMNPGAWLLFTHGYTEGRRKGVMFGQPFSYSALDVGEVRQALRDNGFHIEASIEDYQDPTTGQRDLLILAEKVEEVTGRERAARTLVGILPSSVDYQALREERILS